MHSIQDRARRTRLPGPQRALCWITLWLLASASAVADEGAVDPPAAEHGLHAPRFSGRSNSGPSNSGPSISGPQISSTWNPATETADVQWFAVLRTVVGTRPIRVEQGALTTPHGLLPVQGLRRILWDRNSVPLRLHRPSGWKGRPSLDGIRLLDAGASWKRALATAASLECVQPQQSGAIEMTDWAAAPGFEASLWLRAEADTGALRVARRHRVFRLEPHDERELWIAADDGACLDCRGLLRHADALGSVLGYANVGPLPYGGPASASPTALPFLFVQPTGQGAVLTDQTGAFSFAVLGSGSVLTAAQLSSPYFTVHNLAGPNSQFLGPLAVGSNPPIVFNANPTEFGTAEVNAFHAVSRSMELIESLAPGLATGLPPINVNVNHAGNCHAFHSPLFGLFFTRAGGGCPNTAYGSIIAHEYLHHVLAHLPGSPTEAYEEAMADVFAAFLTGDPRIGPDFLGPGLALRSLAGTAQYPAFAPDPATVGLPLAQAFWRLRESLVGSLGAAPGATLAAELWLGSLLIGDGEISPQIVLDVLTLDDDDADLATGTPHDQLIIDAFAAHGFPAPVQPVANLECQLNELLVELTWQLPSATTYTQVLVLRDGYPVAQVHGSSTSHVDAFPPAGTRVYSVVGMVGGTLASASLCTVTVEPYAAFLRGDANADGLVNLVDVIDLLGRLFQARVLPGCEDAQDVNDSGVIDISDPIALLGHLFLQQGPLPAPYPTPGFDPTPDGLSCQ